MADRPRIYVDSCCFIDAAKHAVGTAPPARNADVWYLRKLCEAHKEHEIELFTSVLTIAECTHADGNQSEAVRNLFDRLLGSGQYISLVQPTIFIGVDARNLRWTHAIALSGPDGLHVASGLSRRCQEFLTTDTKITGNTKKIEALGMRVIVPSKTSLLPAKYRQDDLLGQKVVQIRKSGSGE